MASVSVRYIVNDVDEAIALVSPVPADHPGGGSRPMPDGTSQQPGGWNRFMLEVPDVEGAGSDLRAVGVRFRNEVVTGIGSEQVVIEDPSGNPIELFEPIRPEARLR